MRDSYFSLNGRNCLPCSVFRAYYGTEQLAQTAEPILRRSSRTREARLTETSLRPRIFVQSIICYNPCPRLEALLQYLEWSSWSGKLSWLNQRAVDPCQRKAVSRMAKALQRASSALTFLAAMSLQRSYFCRGTEWSTRA